MKATWVGGPNDGETIDVPDHFREVRVGIADEVAWPDEGFRPTSRMKVLTVPIREGRLMWADRKESR